MVLNVYDLCLFAQLYSVADIINPFILGENNICKTVVYKFLITLSIILAVKNMVWKGLLDHLD